MHQTRLICETRRWSMWLIGNELKAIVSSHVPVAFAGTRPEVRKLSVPGSCPKTGGIVAEHSLAFRAVQFNLGGRRPETMRPTRRFQKLAAIMGFARKISAQQDIRMPSAVYQPIR